MFVGCKYTGHIYKMDDYYISLLLCCLVWTRNEPTIDEEDGVGKPVGLCFKFEGIPCLLLLLIFFFTKDGTGTNVNKTEGFSFLPKQILPTEVQGTQDILVWYSLEAQARY